MHLAALMPEERQTMIFDRDLHRLHSLTLWCATSAQMKPSMASGWLQAEPLNALLAAFDEKDRNVSAAVAVQRNSGPNAPICRRQHIASATNVAKLRYKDIEARIGSASTIKRAPPRGPSDQARKDISAGLFSRKTGGTGCAAHL